MSKTPKLSWSESGYLFIDKTMTAILLPTSIKACELNHARSLVEAAFIRGYNLGKGGEVLPEQGALPVE